MGAADDIINAKLKNPSASQAAVTQAQVAGETKRKPPKKEDPNEEINKGVVGIVKDWFKRQRARWADEAEPNKMPTKPVKKGK